MSDSADGFKEVEVKKEPKGFISHLETEELVKGKKHLRWNRTVVTLVMVGLVVYMNSMVLSNIDDIARVELSMIAEGKLNHADRVINSSIYLALIGGTVAEVSALLVIIFKSLFKNENN